MSESTTPRFTPEQREAWIKAKQLLKQLISDRSDTIRIRALHIAMSELRALRRKHRGPIEAVAKNENKRIERESVDRYYHLRERVEEWKAYFADPGARKLYIIVKDDLSSSQKAVQAAHAAAQFQKEHPLAPWVNGTMVLLTGDPSVKDWHGRTFDLQTFRPYGVHYVTNWREPDMDNQITAVCLLSEFKNESNGQIRGLKLL